MTEVPKLLVTPDILTVVPYVTKSVTLELTNAEFKTILFRTLSTAPNLFYVRPRHGVISSGARITITISLINDDDGKPIVAQGLEKCRSEEFKIEYRIMEEGEIDINTGKAHDSKSISDLIRATPKNRKSSKVIGCKVLPCSAETRAESQSATSDIHKVDQSMCSPMAKSKELDNTTNNNSQGRGPSPTSTKETQLGSSCAKNNDGSIYYVLIAILGLVLAYIAVKYVALYN
eukprot:Tbor_TRINITY_DN4987_c8_g6::TRINITY_DN4987_c8_g6_i1::g.9822::m.9822